MLQLREYQKTAVDRLMWDLENPGNSIVSLAQGGGKTVIIAEFASRLNRPLLILVPNKEILTQDYDEMCETVDKNEIGIFSASMDRKEVKKYTIATIQSAYKHPELFAHYDIALIDEADLLPIKQLNSMYQKFFKNINIKKVVGLTGTPFRQDTYYKEPPEGWALWKARRWKNYANLEVVTTTKMLSRFKEGFWTKMLFVLNTSDLLEQGYLCPLQYFDATIVEHSQIPLNKSKSEFDMTIYEDLIEDEEYQIINAIKSLKEKHKSILVFCVSVDQAVRFQKIVDDSEVVTGETPSKKRTQIIDDFKNLRTQVVFNVNVLSVGFNHPALDCVILARPTRSLRWHLQALGRATRIFPGKKFATIVDFSGNVKNLGTLESIKVQKVNNLWNVVSDTNPDGFHMQPLFTFKLRPKTKNTSDMLPSVD